MSNGRMFWGFVLLLVGAFFLADNLGYMPFDAGLLWPALIILLGIFIIVGARNPQSAESEHVSLPLDGAQRAEIEFEHGAGRLRVSGAAASDELLSGDFDFVDVRHQRSGDTAQVHMESRIGQFFIYMFPWNWGGSRHTWDLRLNPEIPLLLEFEIGASANDLDLRDLKVEKLVLETGASSTNLRLPRAAGFTRVDISHGASSLDITIPEGVAASISVDSGLGSISVDQARFPRSGGSYRSADYDSAENKVEINIDTGVSSTTIR